MKSLFLAATMLAFGSAAVAQTSDAAAGAANATMTSQGAEATAPATNSAPARDARGIPVVSATATAPAGVNQMPTGNGAAVPAPNQSAAFAPKPADKEYKACTRDVTDGCVQTYERGRKAG